MKLRKLSLVAIQALLLSVSVISFAASHQDQWGQSKAIDAAVDAYIARFKVPAMSVAVIKSGVIVYCRGWGVADGRSDKAADGDTLYRLASMSKSLTGVLATDLINQKTIELDTKVRDLVPSLPEFHTETCEQLLSHLGGVRHYGHNDDPCVWQTTEYNSVGDGIRLFQNSPLVSDPGEKFSYSAPGYSLVGAMIEAAVEMPFRSYATARFAQWGFPGIHPEFGDAPNRAQIYAASNNKNILDARDNLSWKYPGGGFESSVRELARFAGDLMDGRVLPKEWVDEMWRSRSDASGKPTGYGLGWFVGYREKDRVAEHGGEQNGADSYWRLYPDARIAIVILSDVYSHRPEHLRDWIGRAAIAPEDSQMAPYSPP